METREHNLMVATSTDKLSSMPKQRDINAQRFDLLERSLAALNQLTADQSARLEMALGVTFQNWDPARVFLASRRSFCERVGTFRWKSWGSTTTGMTSSLAVVRALLRSPDIECKDDEGNAQDNERRVGNVDPSAANESDDSRDQKTQCGDQIHHRCSASRLQASPPLEVSMSSDCFTQALDGLETNRQFLVLRPGPPHDLTRFVDNPAPESRPNPYSGRVMHRTFRNWGWPVFGNDVTKMSPKVLPDGFWTIPRQSQSSSRHPGWSSCGESPQTLASSETFIQGLPSGKVPPSSRTPAASNS